MNNSSRWILLEHKTSNDKLKSIHFDLLLEDKIDCRTWKLDQIPTLDGPPVEAKALQPHKLKWLELGVGGASVSGNRGWAKPVMRGTFIGRLSANLCDLVLLTLTYEEEIWLLEIRNSWCNFRSLSPS